MDLLEIDIALGRRSFDLRVSLNLGTETIALVGPSGAGKTSLLRCVAGLERPDAGEIALNGHAWFNAKRNIHVSAEQRRVGYLPQDYALFPHLTVAANVRFAGRRDRPDLLDRVGIGHLAHARPHQLSGGERQRTALARALAREPRVLLLDEPFGALDAITRQQVRDELADILRELELPTLLVTHAFDDASALTQRIGVIAEGRLVQLGTAADLLNQPADVMVAALTGANILEGTATSTSAGSTVRIRGGGELASSTRAHGPVQVAVHPWQVGLADPAAGCLTDTVLGVHRERGGLVIRLARLTIQAPADTTGLASLPEGSTVGVRVAPGNVHVFRDLAGVGDLV